LFFRSLHAPYKTTSSPRKSRGNCPFGGTLIRAQTPTVKSSLTMKPSAKAQAAFRDRVHPVARGLAFGPVRNATVAHSGCFKGSGLGERTNAHGRGADAHLSHSDGSASAHGPSPRVRSSLTPCRLLAGDVARACSRAPSPCCC